MRKVFLCAGHIGQGTGAVGIIDEGLETINLRNNVANILRDRGVNVIEDNDHDSLNAVVNGINSKCNAEDLCLDIHFNAFNGKAFGTEAVHQNYPTHLETEFAEDLANITALTLGTKNRGVKTEQQSQHRTLAMLSRTKLNSVLLEVCFCDNADDCKKYNANKEELAYAIADVIEDYANM